MSADRLVVLQSFPTPRSTTNPYLIQLQQALGEAGVDVLTFSWQRALLGRYDVFHVHWPEILVDGRSPLKKAVRQALFVLFQLRLSATQTPWVRTLHNLELPSGLSQREIWLLRWAERRTTLWITLNPTSTLSNTKAPPHTPTVLVPHGHYRDWFASFPRSERVAGRFGFFGLIRRYKGVEGLVTAFRQLSDPQVSLRVAGRPSSQDLVDEITELAHDDPRIGFHFEFLSDAELVAAASSAELVVLPYREMHNSGGALAALSVDSPVLVPDNATTRDLATEVGAPWVQTFSGELSDADLTRALAAVRDRDPHARPDLSARDWARSAAGHITAYRQAIARKRGDHTSDGFKKTGKQA